MQREALEERSEQLVLRPGTALGASTTNQISDLFDGRVVTGLFGELASMMGKPYVPLPVPLVKGALWLLRRLGRTQYCPEQVDSLRYRPVLSNRWLKEQFSYTPQKSNREVFAHFLAAQQRA